MEVTEDELYFNQVAGSFADPAETELVSSTETWTDTIPSANAEDTDQRQYFDELQRDPKWKKFCTRFAGVDVVLGERIAQGGQAEIFEVKVGGSISPGYVVKMLKSKPPLQKIVPLMPEGVLRIGTRMGTDMSGALVRNTNTGEVRFGFILTKHWGDLRSLIEYRMTHRNGRGPPFGAHQVKWMAYFIAMAMRDLHNRLDIIHKDLKAANIMIMNISGEMDSDSAKLSNSAEYAVKVADFECSVDCQGTKFWNAPEILKQIMEDKSKVPEFTKKSDVYGFAMTLYELVTGQSPFERRDSFDDTRDAVLNGRRPTLPLFMDRGIKEIIELCWAHEPSARPTFTELLRKFGEMRWGLGIRNWD